MYSVVLATALMAGGELPNFHRHGGHGCHGCFGGNAFSCYASSCHGCYGGGCYGGCHGCYGGGCYGGCFGGGCFGGCYSSCSCFGGYACSGCFSSCFSSCSGCYGSGGVVVVPSHGSGGAPQAGGGMGTNGGMEGRIQKLEKAMDRLTDMLKQKEKKRPGANGSDEANQESAPAQITVSLPAAAKLYVDGKLCPLTSSERTFSTSAVAPGQKYFHTLRVEMTSNGQPMSKSRQVVFEAGQHVQVNFNATSGEFTIVRD